jgi:hypothetical protein
MDVSKLEANRQEVVVHWGSGTGVEWEEICNRRASNGTKVMCEVDYVDELTPLRRQKRKNVSFWSKVKSAFSSLHIFRLKVLAYFLPFGSQGGSTGRNTKKRRRW